MNRVFSGRQAALVLVEHTLVVGAILLAARLSGSHPGPLSELLGRSMLVTIVLQVSLHYFDMYDVRTLAASRSVLAGVLRALAVTSLVLAVLYFFVPALAVGRGVFALATAPISLVVTGWRIAFEWLSLRGAPTERILGAAERTRARRGRVRRHRPAGRRPVSHRLDGAGRHARDPGNRPHAPR
jgi:FlaA1/EpsC-like NDP-sugar epimerase